MQYPTIAVSNAILLTLPNGSGEINDCGFFATLDCLYHHDYLWLCLHSSHTLTHHITRRCICAFEIALPPPPSVPSSSSPRSALPAVLKLAGTPGRRAVVGDRVGRDGIREGDPVARAGRRRGAVGLDGVGRGHTVVGRRGGGRRGGGLLFVRMLF